MKFLIQIAECTFISQLCIAVWNLNCIWRTFRIIIVMFGPIFCLWGNWVRCCFIRNFNYWSIVVWVLCVKSHVEYKVLAYTLHTFNSKIILKTVLLSRTRTGKQDCCQGHYISYGTRSCAWVVNRYLIQIVNSNYLMFSWSLYYESYHNWYQLV